MASGPLLEDMECTERCRSVQHGQEICAICTKGTDKEVLSLWKSTCMKFHKIKDEFGRSAIHIAASTGRPKVVEWLVKREGCDVNVKDLSGYTPLHRSIYFGHVDCARTLIRLDASLSIGDNEGYFPLDLCRVDSPLSLNTDEVNRGPNEVYVWGSNENYNLGTGSEQPRVTPELLDKSKKMPWGLLGSCFLQVAMERYHTLFLHWSKHVYSCGYGVGGRLGLGNEFTCFIPAKVELGKDCLCMKVAVGPDHSLFLLESGMVKSCGLNENFVLGQSHAMNKVFQPKHVDISTKIIDIAASRFHSAFLAEDYLYVCGVNVGQMLKDESIDKVVKPTKVVFPFELDPKSQRSNHKCKFSHVACTEYATAVAHTGGNIFILKNYDCITLNARHMDIQKIQLVGGNANISWNRDKNSHTDSEVANQTPVKLSMFVLIQTGRLLIWREGSEQSTPPAKSQSKNSLTSHFNLAVFNVGRAVTIKDFAANLNSVILINHTGEGFKAMWNASLAPACYPSINSTASKSSKAVNQWSYVIQQSARHNTGKDPFSNMMLEQVKVKRISNIYGGIAAFSDPRGNNFAITQRHQKADQVILPMTLPSEISRDFGDLLKEASCEDDIHDVVFQVRKFLFPAHRFIIASRCKNLYDQISKELKGITERAPRIVIKDVEPRVFEQILQYLYTADCDMTVSGKFLYAPDDPDWLELLKLYSRKLGLNDLNQRLKSVELENGENRSASRRAKDVKFSWNSHPELYDGDLVSDDGVHIKAHLCVLVARLEYFRNMLLSNFWLEGTKSQKQLRFPSLAVVMNIFIALMYEGKVSYENTGTRKDLEVLSQALIASDLLLSQQYRSEIECLLADCINLETVSEIIQLADVCNAPQIKESCMEFIALNLAPLLENRYLDSVPEEMMVEISEYYRITFTRVQSRKIKDVTAPVEASYQYAEEKYGVIFEDLEEIASSEYVAPRKAQQSKGKIKLPSRDRNLSTSSNHEVEGNNNNSISLDDEYAEELSSSLDTPRKSYQNGGFTVVTKHKSSPHTPKPSKDLPSTAPIPIRNKIPIPSKNFKLPDTPEEKHTPLTPRQAAVPVASPKNTPPLKMSDFPSVADTFKKEKSEIETIGNIENSPPDRGKFAQQNSKSASLGTREQANSNGIAAIGSSRRKTKWVSLDAVAKSPQAPAASSVPSTSPNAWSRDPKNPWERTSTSKNDAKPEAANGNMNFDQILQQEERKKENLQKALEKPLHLSQIEDEAINQLLKRYTSQDVLDGYETLTVELVSARNEYAIPVWRKVTDNHID